MRIDVFAAHWGNNDLPPEVFIDKVLAAGFDGIEMSLPLDAALREEWTQLISKAGLQLIAAQWETVFHSDFVFFFFFFFFFLPTALARVTNLSR